MSRSSPGKLGIPSTDRVRQVLRDTTEKEPRRENGTRRTLWRQDEIDGEDRDQNEKDPFKGQQIENKRDPRYRFLVLNVEIEIELV